MGGAQVSARLGDCGAIYGNGLGEEGAISVFRPITMGRWAGCVAGFAARDGHERPFPQHFAVLREFDRKGWVV